MKNGTIPTTNIKEISQATIGQFPEGYDIPYTVMVREAYMKYKDNGPTRIEIPRYGVLTLDGRRYTFEFNEQYAAKKGYATSMEGVWG